MEGPEGTRSKQEYLRKVREIVPAMGRALARFYGCPRVQEAMSVLIARGTYTAERLRTVAEGPPDETKWRLIVDILTVLGVSFTDFFIWFLREQLALNQDLSTEDQAAILFWSSQHDTPPGVA